MLLFFFSDRQKKLCYYCHERYGLRNKCRRQIYCWMGRGVVKWLVKVKNLVDRRVVKQNHHPMTQWLVQWSNSFPMENVEELAKELGTLHSTYLGLPLGWGRGETPQKILCGSNSTSPRVGGSP